MPCLGRRRHAAEAEIGGRPGGRGCRSSGPICIPAAAGMPELPEVETVMRGLRARLEGRVIARAVAIGPICAGRCRQGWRARLTGRAGQRLSTARQIHPDAAGRRLVACCCISACPGASWSAGRDRTQLTLHEHLVLETDDGWRVGFVDPRRFGSIDLVPTAAEDQHRLLAALGAGAARRRRSRLRCCRRRWPASGRRSRPRCSTRASSPGSATSTSARHCSEPRSARRRSAHTVPGARAVRLGAGDQGDVDRGDRRRRFELARLRAAGR